MRKEAWRRGTTVVETAIVFPVLVLVTLGAIHYGWLFLKAQQITNAARHGARMAILPGATYDSVLEDVNDLMTAAGMPLPMFTMTTEDVTTADPNHPAVTVTITVDSNDVDFMNTVLLPTPANLTARVTMAKEGP
jgi:Flp pilus assembly protein TadG